MITAKANITAVDLLDDDTELLDFCTSPVYCQGELLKVVQLAEVHKDSKTFVDMYQRHDVDVTLKNFENFMRDTNNNPTKEDVTKFISDNFDSVNELESAVLTDWKDHPSSVNSIQDPDYRQWALDLNNIWNILAKKVTDDVKNNPERHSLIYVKNPFIVPGGRFKESYYWDTYWIVKGLLIQEMHNTAKGIIENFLSLVQTYGFIPNGARVYFLMRSQLPVLIPMIDNYYKATGDWDFVDQSLAVLEKEFKYWRRWKQVTVEKNGKNYTFARYFIRSQGPRPESFREDYKLVENLVVDPDRKRSIYNNLKGGAESGWDFSVRWCVTAKGEQSMNLADIATGDIVPVELNAFLEMNARILAGYFLKKHELPKSKFYSAIAKQYREGIDEVLWNEEDGTWYDYDIRHQKSRNRFFASNLAPLYTGSYDSTKVQEIASRSVKYLKKNGILNFPGGIPTTLDKTGQQWDFPNAWPNIQSIIVQGLRNTKNEEAEKVARELALKWLRSNYLGYKKTRTMYEKYDATTPGRRGGGGEYDVQKGFGWSNGVVLEFLEAYPDAEFESNEIW